MAGPEYGTTEAAWKGVLVESDRLSDLHTKIKDHLSEDVPAQIKSWQKEAYHKVKSSKRNVSHVYCRRDGA